MESVGTRLKEARVRKGFTLAEISARTRINAKNLSALEEDEVCEISSPFFYRSFVRQFAAEVGVEYQSLSPAVEIMTGNMRQPDLPGQGEHLPVRVAPIQARPKSDYSWVMPAALFVGVVVLGSGGFAAWKLYQPGMALQKAAVSSLVHQVTEPASSPKVSASQLTAPPRVTDNPIEPGRVQTVPPSNPTATESIHLELAATERTWLSVSADGKPAYTGILEPTETKVLEGQESAKLRTGNAGGVNIIFNGKPLGAIGPRGGTRTVVFTKTGYEVQPSESIRTLPSSRIGG